MSVVKLLLILLIGTQTGGTPPANDPAKIIVTAKRLSSTESALKSCLERGCSPAEDIAASLAHADNLFYAGDYRAARLLLAKARSRNGRYAISLPVPFGDLLRAYGRMSGVEGFTNVSRLAQIESLETLRSGLGRGDARVLAQRMFVAEDYYRQGQFRAGNDVYRSIEKQAIAAGLPQIRGTVLLRQASVFSAMSTLDRTLRPVASERIRQIEITTDPALEPYRLAAAMLRANLAALDGNTEQLEKTIAVLSKQTHTRPMLVYSPQFAPQRLARQPAKMVRADGEILPQWIDVAFQIKPDGRVENIEILRQSDTVNGEWPDDVRQSIANRRYIPIGPNVDPALLQRSERFSMVFDLARPEHSAYMERSKTGRIISFDLTPEPLNKASYLQ